MDSAQTNTKSLNFSEKDQTYFWNCWKFTSKNGQQRWHFELPAELKGIVQSEKDWQKPEAQEFLKHFDQAFVFDKSINPNSADKSENLCIIAIEYAVVYSVFIFEVITKKKYLKSSRN